MKQFKTTFGFTYTAIEIATLATNAWEETQNPYDGTPTQRAESVVDALTDLGLCAWHSAVIVNGEHRMIVDPNGYDENGSRLELEWDPTIGRYDYKGSGEDGFDHCGAAVEVAQHEQEPPMETITTVMITPEWRGMMPLLVEMANSKKRETRIYAISELARLATWADKVNADPVNLNRPALLEVVRVALSDPRTRDIVADELDLSDAALADLLNVTNTDLNGS